MIIQTKKKIFLASLAYHPIHWIRKILGQPNKGKFKRSGYIWELDLGEVVDFMIYLVGGFENYLSDFIRRNLEDGMIALDIGANIGAHTLTMGKSVGSSGKAHAIEATDYAYNKLIRNIGLNPEIVDHIKAHHCMLIPDTTSPEIFSQEIHSSWPFQSQEKRHQSHQGVLKTIGEAQKISLDQLSADLGISRLDLIKIDVDGNEWNVLSGGRKTIDRFRPIIIMEIAPDYREANSESGFPQIHRFLTELDYRFYTFDGKVLPDQAEELARVIPEGASINVVVVNNSGRMPRFS